MAASCTRAEGRAEGRIQLTHESQTPLRGSPHEGPPWSTRLARPRCPRRADRRGGWRAPAVHARRRMQSEALSTSEIAAGAISTPEIALGAISQRHLREISRRISHYGAYAAQVAMRSMQAGGAIARSRVHDSQLTFTPHNLTRHSSHVTPPHTSHLTPHALTPHTSHLIPHLHTPHVTLYTSPS